MENFGEREFVAKKTRHGSTVAPGLSAIKRPDREKWSDFSQLADGGGDPISLAAYLFGLSQGRRSSTIG